MEYLKSIQGGRAMIDVWTIPTTCHGKSEHTEPYPVEIPRRAIMATCPSGGCVLDPFCGSGTERRGRFGTRVRPCWNRH